MAFRRDCLWLDMLLVDGILGRQSIPRHRDLNRPDQGGGLYVARLEPVRDVFS